MKNPVKLAVVVLLLLLWVKKCKNTRLYKVAGTITIIIITNKEVFDQNHRV